MNKASKVEAVLNAWLEFIALEDLSNAKVPGNEAVLRGVQLVGDCVRIEQATFSDLQQALQEERGRQDTTWVLSFPQISTVNRGQSELCPLFSLDATSILKGEYREEGWNLNDLELTEAGKNLATFLELDEEQCEQLITQEGLRRFLDTTFGLKFDTYEDWMRCVNIPRSYQIQRQPYLFRFQGSGFSWNLKQDLKEIKSRRGNWLKQGYPADEYLFGLPKLPEHEVTYMGAFPTHSPTDSQLKVLKHTTSQPLTAVQGPPGSGKTTLILHVIAQQVVKRALILIEKGEEINNLTVVSSTNNKAVENVYERLDESLQDELFYLKGGKKDNINSPDGAKQQIQKALDYLQKCNFDENRWHSLAEEIKAIKEELVAQEKHYQDLRSQRASDEERLSELGERIQRLKQHLDEVVSARTQFERRAAELAPYAQLPIDAYRRIQVCFDTAELQLPEGRVSWWIRLWRWLTGTTEKRILAKTALACQSEIQQTLDGSFRVEVPTSRSVLIRQGQLVRERLANAQELQSVQGRLREIHEDAASTEQKRSEASWEFTSLERKLATPLEDFYASFHTRCHEQHKELFKLSREFLCQEALRSKDRVKPTLELYSNFLSGDKRASNKMAGNLDEHLKVLSLMFPVITCGLLSVRNMLPWIEECVDRTIVDEAGMIPLHQTFPLLVRSHKAIVVGDPLQIEPIINQNPSTLRQYHQKAFIDKGLTESDIHCYSPDEVNSATTYQRAAGASEEEGTGQGIRLLEHYRCQPSIISFCERIAGYGLEVKTKPISSRLESNLIAYHVEGNISGKVNQEEVTAVCELIQHLVNQGYSLSEDIGVISAFRHQANELSKCLTRKFPELQKDYIGTIHTFQGSEKRVIILSTMVCSPLDKNKVDWINKRLNLLNVAVSRAKEVFILVGNLYRLEKAEGFTRQLVEHIREHGVILEYKPETKNPYQSSSIYPVFDCDHLGYFSKAIQEVEEELIIVTPWIRGSEPKRFANDIISALERGVKVKVIYGYRNTRENYDNDDNDALAERNLKELFFQYQDSTLIRLGEETYIDSRGTNEQILICDTKFAVVGSWNWLSHFYRDSCSKKLVNPKVQIRQETSVLLSESSPILSLKERVNQLIQQYRNL